jgi:hypothetical protein
VAGNAASYGRKYTELQEKIAALKAEFGEPLVKAEVNRRPRLKNSGRPKVRHYIRLFTLWLIVEALKTRENGKIDRACKAVEEMGGIFEHRGYKGTSCDFSSAETSAHPFVIKKATVRR